jgi:hypothetical protein
MFLSLHTFFKGGEDHEQGQGEPAVRPHQVGGEEGLIQTEHFKVLQKCQKCIRRLF